MGQERPLVAGNWKMFGRLADLGELRALDDAVRAASRVEVLICLPACYVAAALAAANGSAVAIGAQDCAPLGPDAARTGDISAQMLADCGAHYVIVGHSERRTIHGESDATVKAKAEAALAAGLTPIVCVGETEAERARGAADEVVRRQVRHSVPAGEGAIVVAYEPVWAIGGARTPTSEEIATVHRTVREGLMEMSGRSARVLYGGSVGPKNAREIFSTPGVDGALVGRASLKAVDFAAIVLAHPAAA